MREERAEIHRRVAWSLYQAASAAGIPPEPNGYPSLDAYLDAILQAASETTAVAPDQYHIAYALRAPGNQCVANARGD